MVSYLSLLLVLTVSRRRDRLTNNKAEKDIKIPVKVYFTGIFCKNIFAKIFSLNTLVDKGKSFEEKSVNISIYQGTGSSIKAGYCDRIRAESSDDHAEFK